MPDTVPSRQSKSRSAASQPTTSQSRDSQSHTPQSRNSQPRVSHAAPVPLKAVALSSSAEAHRFEAQRSERRKIGRPKQTEVKDVRQTALFTRSEWEAVKTVLPEGQQPGPWLRGLALEHAKVGLNATVVDKAMSGTENVRARFLTKAPCGPWTEAMEHAGEFVLSADIADELQVRPNDVLVRAVGESMEGAGILDGALVVMRPLPEHRVPRNGEIALVEVTCEDGEAFGTIKHWHSGGPGQPPRLTDGEGQDFPLPEGVTHVRAVAVADGVIARL